MSQISSTRAEQASARIFNDSLANEKKAERKANRQESEQSMIQDRVEIKSRQRSQEH